jgi:hypothetical protein
VLALSQEDISDMDSLTEALHGMEEPQVMGEHEECSDSHVVVEGSDA